MSLNKTTVTKGICTLAAFALISSAAFAYFTDKENKTNTFTVGSVDIELEEPNWPGDDPQDESEKDITPLTPVAKDPQVTNTGKNDAYVYLEVTLPKATVITANEDGTKNEAANVALFSYKTNENWKELTSQKREDDHSVTYVYAYEKVLSPTQVTNPLFNEVALINLVEGQLVETTQNIEVVAKAIQADSTGTIEEAYTKLVNQNQ